MSGRWVLEPGVTVGLPSGFALYARAPFAVMDAGIDKTHDLTPAGPFPPVVGGLVPLYRSPFTDARVSLRAEATLPMGDASSFRGDDAPTGRVSLVYGGPLMRSYSVLSLGMLFLPTRSADNLELGGPTLTGGAAFRLPADSPVGAVVSLDSRAQVTNSAIFTALGSAGVDVRFGGSTLRGLVGLETRFDGAVPNVWFGLAWVERATVVLPRSPAAAPIVASAPLGR